MALARTDDTCDLQVDINAVEMKIKAVESKEARLEGALEGNGSYLGSTDHVRLNPTPVGAAFDTPNGIGGSLNFSSEVTAKMLQVIAPIVINYSEGMDTALRA